MKTSTVNKVRLPIDDVVDRVYDHISTFEILDSGQPTSADVLDLLAGQTEYVVRGVLAKHRAEKAGS